jgi:hypothetical protein
MSVSLTTQIGVSLGTIVIIMLAKYILRKSGNTTAAEYF